MQSQRPCFSLQETANITACLENADMLSPFNNCQSQYQHDMPDLVHVFNTCTIFRLDENLPFI